MLMKVGQVTGDEKYDAFISNIIIIWSSSSIGIV